MICILDLTGKFGHWSSERTGVLHETDLVHSAALRCSEIRSRLIKWLLLISLYHTRLQASCVRSLSYDSPNHRLAPPKETSLHRCRPTCWTTSVFSAFPLRRLISARAVARSWSSLDCVTAALSCSMSRHFFSKRASRSWLDRL